MVMLVGLIGIIWGWAWVNCAPTQRYVVGQVIQSEHGPIKVIAARLEYRSIFGNLCPARFWTYDVEIGGRISHRVQEDVLFLVAPESDSSTPATR
jgi:hypothetical protein